MTFDLVDPDNLILKLSSYQELTAETQFGGGGGIWTPVRQLAA